MDIRAAAEQGLKHSLEAVGVDATFTDPDTSNTQTVKAQVTRVDSQVDPNTGVRVYAPHTAVTARLSSFSLVPDEGWPVETTDVTGETVDGVCRDVVYDHTMGTITVMVEDAE
jgi:hypothetical protein